MKDKALELIEDIAGEIAYTEDIKSLKEKLSDIYSIAHIANGHCENKHSDWVKKYKLAVNYKKFSELLD